MDVNSLQKFVQGIMSQGQLASRVATTLIVTFGIAGATWTASEKWEQKADKGYVDKQIMQVDSKIESNKAKADFITQKLMESTIAQIELLKQKLRDGKGTDYDRDQLKYLENELQRLRDIQSK